MMRAFAKKKELTLKDILLTNILQEVIIKYVYSDLRDSLFNVTFLISPRLLLACLLACKYNLWSRRMSLTKEKPLSPKRVVPDKITNARYSFDLLLSDRRRWRTYIQGQVSGRNVSLYRHLLRLGLLLALARVSKVRVPVGLWSIRRALHHTLYRR